MAATSGIYWLGQLFLPGSPEEVQWLHQMQMESDIGRPLCKIEENSSFTQTVFTPFNI
jgi:hypothetical protein